MPRSLLLSLLVIATAIAAPVPKKPVKDYQKLADETEWQFTPVADFETTLAAELQGYEVKATDGRADTTVVVSKDEKELLSFRTYRQGVVRQCGGIVYYTAFSPWSSGCRVIAFDLKSQKQLWKSELKGLGPIDHSKYRSEVRMEVLDDDTLRVFGKESSGRYVEVVSRADGKTLGHKVFDEKK